MEKETLEDICNKIRFINPRERVAYYNGLKFGAKWQAERMVTKEAYESTQTMIKASNEGFLSKINELEEKVKRMYSEEDMIEFAKWIFLEVGSNTCKDRTNKELFNEWFEQFKKK